MHNIKYYLLKNSPRINISKTMKNRITLNLIGLRCPEPIMMIRKKFRSMKKNEIILIIADDPSTIRDIPKFCQFMQHKLLKNDVSLKPYRYLLKKGI